MSTCTCETYRLAAPNGEILEGELRRDPECRQHGFPTDKWPAGHPLRVHRLVVDRATGETMTHQEANARYRERPDDKHWWGWSNMFRDETPRETEARLYEESRR